MLFHLVKYVEMSPVVVDEAPVPVLHSKPKPVRNVAGQTEQRMVNKSSQTLTATAQPAPTVPKIKTYKMH